MATSRMRRVNEVMREVISTAIASDLHDERIGFVTVTDVETSSDLRHAAVHVSVLGDDEARAQTLEALDEAAKTLQDAIASQMRLKRTPTLRFAYDDSIERADRLTRKLSE